MKHAILAYTDFDKKTLEYTIFFDAVTGITESYSNQVTTHTVEDGGVINDHVIKTKDKINIEGVVTDLSFNQGDFGLVMFLPDGSILADQTEAWSLRTKKMLIDINERSLPCSVKSSYKENGQEVIEREVFPCLIESLNLDSSGGQTGLIQPKITFVPVRIARLEFTELTADQQAIPLLKQQNNAGGSTDAKMSTGSTDSASADDKEVALGIEDTIAKAEKEGKDAVSGGFGPSSVNTKLRSVIDDGYGNISKMNQMIGEVRK